MITLLASIAGFFSSIFPEILKLIKDSNDKRHELAVMDRQIKVSASNQQSSFHELDLKYSAAEQYNLYSTYKTGINWIDALNGTVRPVLAYAFFMMYMGVKILQYLSLKHYDAQSFQYLQILWTLDDQAIFAGIISFYFGQRTFNKVWRSK